MIYKCSFGHVFSVIGKENNLNFTGLCPYMKEIGTDSNPKGKICDGTVILKAQK